MLQHQPEAHQRKDSLHQCPAKKTTEMALLEALTERDSKVGDRLLGRMAAPLAMTMTAPENHGVMEILAMAKSTPC
jgi:hypothetical protein